MADIRNIRKCESQIPKYLSAKYHEKDKMFYCLRFYLSDQWQFNQPSGEFLK